MTEKKYIRHRRKNKYPRQKGEESPRSAFFRRCYEQRGLKEKLEKEELERKEREKTINSRIKHLIYRSQNVSTYRLSNKVKHMDAVLFKLGMLSKTFGLHTHIRLSLKGRNMLNIIQDRIKL